MAEPYLRQLRDLLDELGLADEGSFDLEGRHFFGGAALYVDGTICASLTPAGLAVKLPHATREAMFEDGRGQPLRYFEGGKVKREYVVLSQPLSGDPSRVRALLRDSFRYVRDA